MSFGEILSLLAAIVGVAMVFVVVNGKQTSGVIKAFGNLFTSSLSTAMGNVPQLQQ